MVLVTARLTTRPTQLRHGIYGARLPQSDPPSKDLQTGRELMLAHLSLSRSPAREACSGLLRFEPRRTTHPIIALWALRDPGQLTATERALLVDPSIRRCLSPMSVWWAALKRRVGRIRAPRNLATVLAAEFRMLER